MRMFFILLCFLFFSCGENPISNEQKENINVSNKFLVYLDNEIIKADSVIINSDTIRIYILKGNCIGYLTNEFHKIKIIQQ